MSSRSMTDVAFDFLSKRKKEVPFNKLWEEVSHAMGFKEEVAYRKIASFYEAMMLDNRFTSKDNKWDLSSRHKFSETHIDLSAIEIDDDSKSDYDNEDYVDEDGNSTEGYERENEEEDIY